MCGQTDIFIKLFHRKGEARFQICSHHEFPIQRDLSKAFRSNAKVHVIGDFTRINAIFLKVTQYNH